MTLGANPCAIETLTTECGTRGVVSIALGYASCCIAIPLLRAYSTSFRALIIGERALPLPLAINATRDAPQITMQYSIKNGIRYNTSNLGCTNYAEL